MKIDERVERLVREGFGAAVARDSDRFVAALQTIAAAGDQTANTAVNLALKITAYALLDIPEGMSPDEEQIHDLAKDFCEMEEWAVPDEAAAFPSTGKDWIDYLDGILDDLERKRLVERA